MSSKSIKVIFWAIISFWLCWSINWGFYKWLVLSTASISIICFLIFENFSYKYQKFPKLYLKKMFFTSHFMIFFLLSQYCSINIRSDVLNINYNLFY